MSGQNPSMKQMVGEAIKRAERERANGHLDRALLVLQKMEARVPGLPPLLLAMARTELSMKRLGEAEATVRRAIAVDGGHGPSHAVLARVLAELGRMDDALASIDEASRLMPGATGPLLTKAKMLRTMGRLEEAERLLAGPIEGGETHASLLMEHADLLGRLGRSDEAMTGLEALAEREGLDDQIRSAVLFRLAGLVDKAGEHGRAFEIVAEANRLRSAVHDPAREQRHLEAMQKWTAKVHAGLPRSRSEDESPVFIVGMPRSGSTLVEQIIASHPLCAGAGERWNVPRLATRMLAGGPAQRSIADRLAGIDKAELAEIASSELASLRESAAEVGKGDAARIVDKQLHNFQHLGLIELIHPRARVIHCVRDAMDTCVSCFFLDFGGRVNVGFAYDLEHLGRSYKVYEELMTHWRGVIGLEVLEVRYEDMVAQQESQSRRVIEFLGLEWDDACLRYYETKRAVMTHSTEQVRKPMYSSSVGRAERYGELLGPLRAALGLGERSE